MAELDSSMGMMYQLSAGITSIAKNLCLRPCRVFPAPVDCADVVFAALAAGGVDLDAQEASAGLHHQVLPAAVSPRATVGNFIFPAFSSS
jgi:hypothetical protein